MHAKAISASPHSIPTIVESYYWGWISVAREIWLNVCAGIVKMVKVGSLGYCYLPTCLLFPFQAISRAITNCAQRRHATPTALTNDFRDEVPAPLIRQPPKIRSKARPHWLPGKRQQPTDSTEMEMATFLPPTPPTSPTREMPLSQISGPSSSSTSDTAHQSTLSHLARLFQKCTTST